MVIVKMFVHCFVCDRKFNNIDEDIRIYDQHLLNEHSILIPLINNYEQFLEYTQKIHSFDQIKLEGRVSTDSVERYGKTVQYWVVDKEDIGEDQIKHVIQKNFLERILKEAQKEREDNTFSRNCLFCKKVFNENRAQLFDHLYHDHNFFVGHPDNIVDSYKFLDILEDKLQNLLCLYCEKTFKSWNVLKEHMRKKGHKTLNPKNREYDKFYLINYLCSDKHWTQIKNENDPIIEDSSNEDWCDWIDDDQMDCLCFFCEYKNKFENAKQHLLQEHLFDFEKLYTVQDFYDRIKIVNFIRKSISNKQCYICKETFDQNESLVNHFITTQHVSLLPPKDLYHSPEYYFPALEDDSFLQYLDDFEEVN